MGSGPILLAGFAQGFGLGCTFVPLNLLALSGLPHHILTQGTAMRALMRMLGGSIGIAILETQLTQNTQIVHSRLMEHLRPDNPLAQSPFLSAPFSLTDPSGIAALNHEVTRQAAMIAYIDDFALMLIVILASLPLLLLVRGPRRQPRRRSKQHTGDAVFGALPLESRLSLSGQIGRDHTTIVPPSITIVWPVI